MRNVQRAEITLVAAERSHLCTNRPDAIARSKHANVITSKLETAQHATSSSKRAKPFDSRPVRHGTDARWTSAPIRLSRAGWSGRPGPRPRALLSALPALSPRSDQARHALSRHNNVRTVRRSCPSRATISHRPIVSPLRTPCLYVPFALSRSAARKRSICVACCAAGFLVAGEVCHRQTSQLSLTRTLTRSSPVQASSRVRLAPPAAPPRRSCSSS